MVASLVKKALLEQGKQDEEGKDSPKEVGPILVVMSVSDASGSGKYASNNDLALAPALKIDKITKKTKDKS